MDEKPISPPDRTPLFTAVGKGLTDFSTLEFAVSMVFASLLEPANRAYSVAAISAARSFEAKMKMTDAVAEVALEKSDLQTWRNLSCRIGKRRLFRDKLAHWMVGHYPGIKNFDEIKNLKVGLLPPSGSSAQMQAVWDHNGQHPYKALTIADLEQFSELTIELINELFKFGSHISPTNGMGKDR